MAATGYNGVFPQLGATDTMLLYHFLNANYGLEAIKNRRLKISRLMDLNDPFEYLSVELSDETLEDALEKTKTYLGSEYGILCFSTTWTNPVLWGHYANKHKGICLGFEVNEQPLAKIDYVDNRLEVPHKIDCEFMGQLISTKFRHWEYEKEYRMWTSLKKPIDGLCYVRFSDELKLTRVIVGCKSDVTRAQVTDALGDLPDDVEQFKSRPGLKEFKVIRNEDESLWC